MDVTISDELFEAVGAKAWKLFGIEEDKRRWNNTSTIDLTRTPIPRVKKLRELVVPHTSIKGTRAVLRDVDTWLEAAEKGAGFTKCKNTKQFATLAFEWLQRLPVQRLYKKDEARDCWVAYYVGNITFKEKRVTRDSVEPAYTRLGLYYTELGLRQKEIVDLHDHEVKGHTAPEALAAMGYLPESVELRAEYDALLAKYIAIHDKVGKQFFADGVGTDDLDGNPERGYWRSVNTFKMRRNDEPSRVVIDVKQEGDKSDREKDDHLNPLFWRQKSYLDADEDEEPETVRPEDVDVEEEKPLDIPVFPVVPTFDLQRHLRLRVHVDNLTEYVYDRALGEKLVLPDESRDLVNLLLSHKSKFQDVIKGKGGGSIILCAGVPGTGKTLTSEVYAEVMEKPLYTVQCSQLGTDEEQLEERLMKCFVRAQRWNAILLLDEADVYVAARGKDLQQNAIVGVFLRVLEYYQGVLFLTTNRADLVDDAIASRCIARIDYGIPTVENQRRIWSILSTTSGIKLSTPAIERIVRAHPKLSGRDIKQLLKLSSMVADSKGEPITEKTVDFVKRFKPTKDDESTGA